jgi:hypothetical protein
MKGTQKGIKVKVDNIFDEFHTYSVDWNANRLKFYIDDKETFSYYKESDAQEDSWPFDNEMNIIMHVVVCAGQVLTPRGIGLNRGSLVLRFIYDQRRRNKQLVFVNLWVLICVGDSVYRSCLDTSGRQSEG